MANAKLKTQKNEGDVDVFLASVSNEKRRKDAFEINKIMREVTGETPVMWGSSIVGFGLYHYASPSGREGDWMKIGFSPRKAALTLYLLNGFADYQELLAQLGPHTTGKSCLYIKSLGDIDMQVLKKMIDASYKSDSLI